jgi:hypothetical protein
MSLISIQLVKKTLPESRCADQVKKKRARSGTMAAWNATPPIPGIFFNFDLFVK